MPPRLVRTPDDARAVLVELGAPARLVTHGSLVLEASEMLLAGLRVLGLAIDEPLVRAGAMLHDVGKIAHPSELRASGNHHEPAGETMLLELGVDPRVARHCLAHARWSTMDVSVEELLVALADALWKGVRREALEQRVVDEIAQRRGVDRWQAFADLDPLFERVCEGADDRLRRSTS